MSNSTEIHQIRGNGRCAVRWMDGWINEQMGGLGRGGEGRGGEGWGNVSRGRPSPDDERSPLQLSQVDPHLCTVTCLSHPNLIGPH